MIASTERLRIRKLTVDDADFVLTLLNDPAFVANIGDKGVRSLADAERFILAQALQALASLAPQLGMAERLEGWEGLSQQMGEDDKVRGWRSHGVPAIMRLDTGKPSSFLFTIAASEHGQPCGDGEPEKLC